MALAYSHPALTLGLTRRLKKCSRRESS